jgi:hypothetical protein
MLDLWRAVQIGTMAHAANTSGPSGRCRFACGLFPRMSFFGVRVHSETSAFKNPKFTGVHQLRFVRGAGELEASGCLATGPCNMLGSSHLFRQLEEPE